MKKRIKSILSLIVILVFALSSFSTAFAVERVTTKPSTSKEKAPKSNIFQLKGSSEKFILLDSTDEGYFVITQKYCAIKPYSQNGKPVAFDPEDKNSIAYWLNNDYINDKSFEKRLPDIMIENLVERVYTTEGGGSYVPFSSAYDVKCKVVLLSQTEWSKYNGKYGYADDTSMSSWSLRTVRDMNGEPLVAVASGAEAGLTAQGKWTSTQLGIRPAFYLSKDFFEKASIDIDKTGDSVIAAIRKGNTAPALSQIYNTLEMSTLTETPIAPTVSAISIKGRGIVGEKITGKYTFVSSDGREENGTVIQWQKNKDKTDESGWSTIMGAESLSYFPTTNDIGYYIRMMVTPATEAVVGASGKSDPLNCTIRDISVPQATNVRIETLGSLKPGAILDAKYTYYDENRDLCSKTEYIWEISADGKTTEKQIGSTRYLKLTNQEGGKYVRVGVTPNKKTVADEVADRITVSGETVYTDWVCVENLPKVASVKVSREADAKISVSKTKDGVSIKGLLMPTGGRKIETLTAEYSMPSGDYEVVIVWEGADSKDGTYNVVSTGVDVLEYVPENTMWVRAKVYTKNSENSGFEVYSEPLFIGEDNVLVNEGEYTSEIDMTSGKQYEIWVVNDKGANSYVYSIELENTPLFDISSDKYLIKTIQKDSKTYVIGTLNINEYNNGRCFKAGEITAKEDGKFTISGVLTTKDSGDVSQARIFVVEK